jgi:hypothetical protein
MDDQQAVGRRRAVRLLGAAGAAGAGAALFAGADPGRDVDAAGATAPVVGTWLIDSPGPSIALIHTWHADGTFLSVDDQHPTRSPQPGVWEQIGEREFLFRHLSFRFDRATGTRNGSIEVRGRYTVEPSGMTMRGRGVRLELDLAGTLLQPPIPWTADATRMTVVPID